MKYFPQSRFGIQAIKQMASSGRSADSTTSVYILNSTNTHNSLERFSNGECYGDFRMLWKLHEWLFRRGVFGGGVYLLNKLATNLYPVLHVCLITERIRRLHETPGDIANLLSKVKKHAVESQCNDESVDIDKPAEAHVTGFLLIFLSTAFGITESHLIASAISCCVHQHINSPSAALCPFISRSLRHYVKGVKNPNGLGSCRPLLQDGGIDLGKSSRTLFAREVHRFVLL
ncbi:hypothetical protein J6590_078357 [Homalodisca vitripennis]|nr:hypothetical protein J6590_078357 [Homalodisca vitripennis]